MTIAATTEQAFSQEGPEWIWDTKAVRIRGAVSKAEETCVPQISEEREVQTLACEVSQQGAGKVWNLVWKSKLVDSSPAGHEHEQKQKQSIQAGQTTHSKA